MCSMKPAGNKLSPECISSNDSFTCLIQTFDVQVTWKSIDGTIFTPYVTFDNQTVLANCSRGRSYDKLLIGQARDRPMKP